MKPDWKDAPEWANWLAMDSNGVWHWFKLRPVYVGGHSWQTTSKHQIATVYFNAKDTLEERQK